MEQVLMLLVSLKYSVVKMSATYCDALSHLIVGFQAHVIMDRMLQWNAVSSYYTSASHFFTLWNISINN